MDQALPVAVVVAHIKEYLELDPVLSDLWIVGEVTDYRGPTSGHRYFSVKDEGGRLRTAMFARHQPGIEFKNGDRVLVHGYVSIYPARGELQFYCDFLRPEGVGIINAKFEELKERLTREGLFEPSRKRALPPFPYVIGVVTSSTGAALQDIQNVIARRWPLAELVISPTLVQGDTAPRAIVTALRRLALVEGLDVVIIARGGGSQEDLWAFNDEAVARAIFAFPVPTISGVGHETDQTITDWVADLRAPTPSAAAERATPDIREIINVIDNRARRMANATRTVIRRRDDAIVRAGSRLSRSSPDVRTLTASLAAHSRAMGNAIERGIAQRQTNAEHMDARVASLNPMATLRRGFAIVERANNGKVINSMKKVKGGDRLAIGVADGKFWAEVS